MLSIFIFGNMLVSIMVQIKFDRQFGHWAFWHRTFWPRMFWPGRFGHFFVEVGHFGMEVFFVLVKVKS